MDLSIPVPVPELQKVIPAHPCFWVPLEYLGYDGSNELRGQSVARRIEPTRNKSFYRMDKEIDEKVIFLHKTLRVVIVVIVVIVNQKSD